MNTYLYFSLNLGYALAQKGIPPSAAPVLSGEQEYGDYSLQGFWPLLGRNYLETQVFFSFFV